MTFNGFDENEKNEFSEKPLESNPSTFDDPESLNVSEEQEQTLAQESAEEKDSAGSPAQDTTMYHQTYDSYAASVKPEDEYKRFRQYSEYSNRMNMRRPVDAAFYPQQQQYQTPPNEYAYGNAASAAKPKRKTGVIVLVTVLCVLFALSVFAFSVYAIINSQLGSLIGYGITNALGQPSETILPGGISDPEQAAIPSPVMPGGVENPPSFDIVSVVPAEIEKIYDDTGREILNASQIYELVSPTVVSITSKVASDNGLGYTSGSGSGIIFSSDGFIITNAHVVNGALTVNVQLPSDNETLYPATIIGIDTKADLAVLKIEAEGLPTAEFGDSDMLKIGDQAVAIGNPTTYDLQGATTQGIISGLNRVMVVDDNGRTLQLIQTDAAINPGNSGGPLINCYGQVVGINTVGLRSVTYEGLNFAIPSNIAKPIIEELLAYGYVKGYPSIGITGQAITAYQAQMYGAPLGVIVATVHEKSDAFQKGLQPYDIITHINGQSVTSIAELNTVKNRFAVGDSVTLTINRDGKSFDISIVLMDEVDMK